MIDTTGLLQDLIRIDTTNPPGSEAPAIARIAREFDTLGVAYELLEHEPGRPNLLARLEGRGERPGVLMHGHLDVVPVTGQRWTRNPFGGELLDGWIWGRGALDMKGPVVMMVDAFLRAATVGAPPAGDIVLAVVSDEEMHGTVGAKFLVDEHADRFAGVQYALGEFGGFPLHFDGIRFYPIQVAERINVGFEITVEGPGGHGSLPISGGAMAKAGRILTTLDRRRLPIHITEPAQLMFDAMEPHLDGASAAVIRRLADPRTAAATLRVLRDRVGIMEPMLRNTVSATIIRGGDKHNVIPSEVTISLDGRMLPGFTAGEFEDEVRRLLPRDVSIRRVEDGAHSPADVDMGLFDSLASAIRELDPDGIPIPFLMPAVTDGRWFAGLGIQHYGFCPMTLPEGFEFQKTVHAEDERIPVAALGFGADALHRVIA